MKRKQIIKRLKAQASGLSEVFSKNFSEDLATGWPHEGFAEIRTIQNGEIKWEHIFDFESEKFDIEAICFSYGTPGCIADMYRRLKAACEENVHTRLACLGKMAVIGQRKDLYGQWTLVYDDHFIHYKCVVKLKLP